MEAARSLEILAGEIGVEHVPVATALVTYGAEFLFDYAQRGSGEGVDARELVVVRNGQRVFQPVIEDCLRRISRRAERDLRRIGPEPP